LALCALQNNILQEIYGDELYIFYLALSNDLLCSMYSFNVGIYYYLNIISFVCCITQWLCGFLGFCWLGEKRQNANGIKIIFGQFKKRKGYEGVVRILVELEKDSFSFFSSCPQIFFSLKKIRDRWEGKKMICQSFLSCVTA
jgi:hypothetical protein